MYGQSRHAVMLATFVTDSTFTTALNIIGANKVVLEVPTFAAGISTDSANVYANVCDTATGTFRRLKDQGIYSSVSGIHDWEVARGIGDYYVVCAPAVGLNYIKFELAQGATFNATSTAGLSARVHVIN